MQSTLTSQETDPHDIFVIEPDVVLAARADKPPAGPANDAVGAVSAPPVHPLIAEVSGIRTGASVPPVDTTFRATAVNAPAVDTGRVPGQGLGPLPDRRPSRGRWVARALVGFLFAICSAMAAAAWQHYGDTAKERIASWVPSFALTSSPSPEKPAAAETAAVAPVQATATDQAAPPPAPPAQAADGTPPAATANANPAESTQAMQSMARDMATMGQEIEQLKASIEQLKAGQEKISQQMSRDLVRNTVARLSEPRARIAPPRPAARKPKPIYTPAQAARAPVLPPPQAAAPMVLPPEPAAQTSEPGGDPVVRPPMPLR
jgi:hypothetical protein